MFSLSIGVTTRLQTLPTSENTTSDLKFLLIAFLLFFIVPFDASSVSQTPQNALQRDSPFSSPESLPAPKMASSGVAVVVGVGGGLGEAIAKKFAGAGLHVALIARTESYLAKVQKDIEGAGGSASFYTCDATKEDQVKVAAGKILSDAKKDGRTIEVLVYNPRFVSRGRCSLIV